MTLLVMKSAARGLRTVQTAAYCENDPEKRILRYRVERSALKWRPRSLFQTRGPAMGCVRAARRCGASITFGAAAVAGWARRATGDLFLREDLCSARRGTAVRMLVDAQALNACLPACGLCPRRLPDQGRSFQMVRCVHAGHDSRKAVVAFVPSSD